MNFFVNLKISHHLLIVMVSVLLSFILIALTYNAVLSFEHESSQRIAKLEKNQILVEKTHTAYLKARIHEEGFFFLNKKQLITDYSLTLKVLYKDIELLTSNSDSDKILNNLKLLLSNLKQYEQSFNQAAQLVNNIGFTNVNTGQIGEFRKLIHNAETLVRKSGKSNLLASLLQIRRHEKDFMARKDAKYLTRLTKEHEYFLNTLSSSKLPNKLTKNIIVLLNKYKISFMNTADNIFKLDGLTKQVAEKNNSIEPLFDDILHGASENINKIKQQDQQTSNTISYVFISIIVFGACLIAYMLFKLSRKLVKSLNIISNTITLYSKGDNSIRSNISSSDELGELARTFDSMMDERVALQNKIETENETLNDSIIDLLESTSKVSDKDLTIKMKVAENITGPLSDAINQLVDETAIVLSQIKSVANKVQRASETVNKQGRRVSNMAEHERAIIEDAVILLENSSIAMKNMSDMAQECNSIATQTSTTTDNALDTVNETVSGMNDIRETISETEKRIKRLGERSQEITGIVDIINTVAERTHVLALNASMQAAAAGEAGRGFAVVADEVQRLAESSRDSTSRIASLVKNIQTETAETMSVMNTTIDKVVSGSKLAEQAGKKMVESQKNTIKLTKYVNNIAEESVKQMNASNIIMDNALTIKKSTESTNTELQEQAKLTDDLTDFSSDLIKSVAIFKLPAA